MYAIISEHYPLIIKFSVLQQKNLRLEQNLCLTKFNIMKALNYSESKSIRFYLILSVSFLLAGNVSLFSQDVHSVFSTDTVTRFSWGIELKTAGIQDEFATQYGMYAGAVFYHSLMVGMVGSLNVTHPSVNYGYLGIMVKYIYKPASIIHMSCQFTFGSGSTRDYENEKTSMLDNFGNITGTGFILSSQKSTPRSIWEVKAN
jgi:hypothetical protein